MRTVSRPPTQVWTRLWTGVSSMSAQNLPPLSSIHPAPETAQTDTQQEEDLARAPQGEGRRTRGKEGNW